MKKRILTLVLILLLVICMVSCTTKGNNATDESKEANYDNIATNEIYYPKDASKNGAMIVEWKRGYDNLKELCDTSDFIVYADVIGNSRNIDVGLGFVGTQVKVKEVLKGEINEKQIEVFEDGYMNDDGTDYSVEGIPLLKKNMKVILFMRRNAEGIDESKEFVYHVVAPTPGKFLFDKDMKIHHSSEVLPEDSVARSMAKGYNKLSGKTYKEFKEEVLKIVNNPS